MPLPATYAFGDAFGVLSSDFTAVVGAPYCTGTGLGRGDTGWNVAVWDTDAFNDAQYSQAEAADGSNLYAFVCVRHSLSAHTGYFLEFHTSGSRILKLSAGSQTELLTGLSAAQDGDIYKLEVSGTTLTAKRFRGGSWSTLGDTTDSDIASGSAGWATYDGTARLDNWEGGNLVSGNPWGYYAQLQRAITDLRMRWTRRDRFFVPEYSIRERAA